VAITNATTIYKDNGTGNYSCNALFQGLFTTNGNDVVVSCTNTSRGTYPVVIRVYKVWFNWTFYRYIQEISMEYHIPILRDESNHIILSQKEIIDKIKKGAWIW
jgi:hypothetical protein